ncbi:hypothetical protein TrRE_jg3366 [Triparma retinervis]|uniref:Ribosomal RNA-processing protein 12-like conserved domain-containing protein n=1 Tax=Triparma retinervis TaxID=2557542 RepID=A0A9W7AJP6_9STRA|nr:hypothetical protein TrRE_jg3366 [Triparma retinervis]
MSSFEDALRGQAQPPQNPTPQNLEMSAVLSAMLSTLESQGSPITPSTFFYIVLTTLTSSQSPTTPWGSLFKALTLTISQAPPEIITSNTKGFAAWIASFKSPSPSVTRSLITLVSKWLAVDYNAGLGSTITGYLGSVTPKTRKHAVASVRDSLTSSPGFRSTFNAWVVETLSSNAAGPGFYRQLRLSAALIDAGTVIAIVRKGENDDIGQEGYGLVGEWLSGLEESKQGVQVVQVLLKHFTSLKSQSLLHYTTALTSFYFPPPPSPLTTAANTVVLEILLKLTTDEERTICRVGIQRISPSPSDSESSISKILAKPLLGKGEAEVVKTLGYYSTRCETIPASAAKFLADKINEGPNNALKRTCKETMKQIISRFGAHTVAETVNIVSLFKGKNRPQVLDCFRNVDSDAKSSLEYVKDVLLPLARNLDRESKMENKTESEATFKKSMVVEVWNLIVPFFKDAREADRGIAEVVLISVMKAMNDQTYHLIPVCCEIIKHAGNRFGGAIECKGKVLAGLFGIGEGKEEAAVGETVKSWVQETKAPTAKIFRKLLQKLLISLSPPYDAAKTATIGHLLVMLDGILPGLEKEEDYQLVYRTIKNVIRTGTCGKRCFKILAVLLLMDKVKDLTDVKTLITETMMTSDVASRCERLKCLTIVVDNLDESRAQDKGFIPEVCGEVLLCLKDSNKGVRERAYECLVKMSDKRENITDFFQILMAALGAKTPHMRSAAVMGLSRIVFERRECEVTRGLVGNILDVVILLFKEEAREVIKAVVGFVRIAVAGMDKDDLEQRLENVVEGLMKWNTGKDRFRAKIKIILKKLIRNYGAERVNGYVPKEDERLIRHIRKVEERERRKKDRGVLEDDEDYDYDEMMDENEVGSRGGKTLMTGMTGRTGMTGMTGASSVMSGASKATGKSARSNASKVTSVNGKLIGGVKIAKDGDGDVVDMLDAGKNVKWVGDEDGYDEFGDEDSDGDEVMEFDDMGRLVVGDGMGGDGMDGLDEEGVRGEVNDLIAAAKSKEEMGKNASGASGGFGGMMKYEKAKEKAEENSRKRRRVDAANAPGARFKSKKAGGDVKRKGQKYEPYAYIPLDGKQYTKKHRGKAVENMGHVVKGKGSKKGKRKNRD